MLVLNNSQRIVKLSQGEYLIGAGDDVEYGTDPHELNFVLEDKLVLFVDDSPMWVRSKGFTQLISLDPSDPKIVGVHVPYDEVPVESKTFIVGAEGSPAYENGWEQKSVEEITQYQANSTSRVEATINAKNAAESTDTIFTFPEGFRPLKKEESVVSAEEGDFIVIETNGKVHLKNKPTAKEINGQTIQFDSDYVPDEDSQGGEILLPKEAPGEVPLPQMIFYKHQDLIFVSGRGGRHYNTSDESKSVFTLPSSYCPFVDQIYDGNSQVFRDGTVYCEGAGTGGFVVIWDHYGISESMLEAEETKYQEENPKFTYALWIISKPFIFKTS